MNKRHIGKVKYGHTCDVRIYIMNNREIERCQKERRKKDRFEDETWETDKGER
jgi:hypothetical protein